MASIVRWRDTTHPARLEELLPHDVVRCHLSPRNCTLKEGQHGFCGVRANRGGRLVSLNYGKSVHITEETIETEAVNHYSPAEPILSLGNIGCMLNCAYCHNWKTSQSKYVEDKDVYYYTPESVVETALRHRIRVLSWTYNDPVVWHEFVIETAALARKAGLVNLFKSAFFITPEAVEELIPFMDIFSISIKSIDPDYYKKYTTGWLQPVLDGCKQVFRAGKHLEVSTLMITDISDDETTAQAVATWVLTELGPSVPLHFVRFHPDYKLRDSVRTPVSRLVRAREIALQMGIEHVYLGNVYDTPWANTYCRSCGDVLVNRYGLNATIIGLDDQGNCAHCGHDPHFKLMPRRQPISLLDEIPLHRDNVSVFDWHGDIRSLHVQALNTGPDESSIYVRRRYQKGCDRLWRATSLRPAESYRFILAKSSSDEIGPEIAAAPTMQTNLHEVFDRAHFPTLSVEAVGPAPNDLVPFPIFAGKQLTHST
jgi:pyruvate formate lyase activating enzyme